MNKKWDYNSKLKDPRWQRKRLQVFDRDNFKCTKCGCGTRTLHVHHSAYRGDPWEISLNNLHTLCETCHTDEHKEVLDTSGYIKKKTNVKKRYLTNIDFMLISSNLSSTIRDAYHRYKESLRHYSGDDPGAAPAFNYMCYQANIIITLDSVTFGKEAKWKS